MTKCGKINWMIILTTTTTILQPLYRTTCLQCFDAVSWATGRASGL